MTAQRAAATEVPNQRPGAAQPISLALHSLRMHQAYREPRELDDRHMDGGEPTDRNGLPRKRGCKALGHSWGLQSWSVPGTGGGRTSGRDRGSAALTFHAVTVPATIRVPLVIHQTGTPSFPGEGVVLEGHWGFSFQL